MEQFFIILAYSLRIFVYLLIISWQYFSIKLWREKLLPYNSAWARWGPFIAPGNRACGSCYEIVRIVIFGELGYLKKQWVDRWESNMILTHSVTLGKSKHFLGILFLFSFSFVNGANQRFSDFYNMKTLLQFKKLWIPRDDSVNFVAK